MGVGCGPVQNGVPYSSNISHQVAALKVKTGRGDREREETKPNADIRHLTLFYCTNYKLRTTVKTSKLTAHRPHSSRKTVPEHHEEQQQKATPATATT